MKKFRVAENKMIHVDGHDFIFLVTDKAIFEMEPSTKEVLSHWLRKAEFTQEEVLAHLTDPSEDREDFFEGLLKRHLIVPVNGKGPERKAAGSAHVSIPLKTLILHVTEACNLGCLYCYYSEGGSSSGKTKRMSSKVARRAVDFLFDHSGNLEEVLLVFFGGEPLLNFKLITSVVEYARKKASERGKRVDFTMTTNGTLLTEEVVRFVQENNISITISIDGFEGVHDRYRRFPDGSPSYGVILPKVKNLIEAARRRRPVSARVTLVEDAKVVPQILDHLLGLGFIEAGFAPVTTGNPDYQLGEKGMDLLLTQFKDLSRRFLQTVQKGEFFGFSNLIDLLVVLHQGEVMNYPCGAGLALFSVAADGRLYLCQRFTGEDEFCMGDIFEGFNQDKLEKFREQAEISQKEACKQCWVRTVCTGGCYHEACVREGSHLKPNLHYCEWIKRWVEIGLEVYGRIAITSPDYLEKLSMSRGHAPVFDQ
jgi:uncharacterized protein